MTTTSQAAAHSPIDDGERPGGGTPGMRSSRCVVPERLQTIPIEPSGARASAAARLDLVAVGLSTLCVLHCIALPLLAALAPLAAQTAESELVHRLLAVAAVPVSLRVIWKTRSVNGNGLFVSAVLGGLGLLLLGAFVEAISSLEQPVTVAGGILLGSAHLWHWVRRCGGVRSARPNPMLLDSRRRA